MILFAFYKLERWKERHDLSPLFEFGELRHRGFRYGLVTSSVLAMGQMGMFFVLPVFLQDAKHLSAETNGFWMLPFGVFMIIGSQLGGYLTRHLGTTRVVQIGLVFEMVGLVILAFVVDPGMSFVDLLVPSAVFGMGIGFASSQLTNVILSDISAEKAGMASGTNSTVRQVGAALGVAVVGSVFASLTLQRTVDAVRASGLPAALRDTAVAGVHAQGAGFPVPSGTPAGRGGDAEPCAGLGHHRRDPAGAAPRRRLRRGRRGPVAPAAEDAPGAGARRAAGRRVRRREPVEPDRPVDRRTRARLTDQARPSTRSTRISIATRAGVRTRFLVARRCSGRPRRRPRRGRGSPVRGLRATATDRRRPAPTAARPFRSTLRTFCEPSPVITRTTRASGSQVKPTAQTCSEPSARRVLSVPR